MAADESREERAATRVQARRAARGRACARMAAPPER
jgi:hypothetical protein